jgi:hypothetical protein
MNILKDIFNNKSDVLEKQVKIIENKVKTLQASISSSPRNASYKSLKPLSELTKVLEDNLNFSTYELWYKNTIAKRVIDIMPNYALQNKPVIYDLTPEGERVTDSPFAIEINKLFNSSYGTAKGSSASNEIGYKQLNLNNTVRVADQKAYGHYGAIYLDYEGGDHTEPIDVTTNNVLWAAYPLSEGEASFNTINGKVAAYNIKLDDGVYLNNVHSSRVVHITDNNKLKHTPRLKDVFIDITNCHDIMVSLRKNLVISNPKIGVTLPSYTSGISLHEWQEVVKDITTMAEFLISKDSDLVLSNEGPPQYIIPTVRDLSKQILDCLTMIAVKKGIPSRILLGTEQYKSASTQDTVNFEKTIQAYREEHLTVNIIQPLINKMIYGNAVPLPSDAKNLSYEVFWHSNNTESIDKILGDIERVSQIIQSNVLNDESQTIIRNINSSLVSSLEKLYNQ